MANELIPIDLDTIQPASLFVDGGIDNLLKRIETEARSLVPDISTEKGRKEVASNAYRVARTKTYIDKLGKDFVADLKAKSKDVDEQRRMARERLDALRDEVRAPLTKIEDAERAHAAAIQERITQMCADPQYGASLDDLRARLIELESTTIDVSFSKWINEAANARSVGIAKHKAAIAEAEAAAEIERQRKEAEEIARKEREERIRKEAAERARREAEELAKAEAERVERERVAAERKAAEAARREREHIESEKRAAEQRAAEAERRAEEAARRERERAEADKRAREISAKHDAHELTRLLAMATTAHEDFSPDHERVIVTIGKGMFWSAEFDQAARALADRIDQELSTTMEAAH